MRKVLRIGSKGKAKLSKEEKAIDGELDTRIEMIQALISIGLEAVAEELKREFDQLAGERYSRRGGVPGHHRWGKQPRCIYLSDQKVCIEAPRVRNSVRSEEVPLSSYLPGVAKAAASR